LQKTGDQSPRCTEVAHEDPRNLSTEKGKACVTERRGKKPPSIKMPKRVLTQGVKSQQSHGTGEQECKSFCKRKTVKAEKKTTWRGGGTRSGWRRGLQLTRKKRSRTKGGKGREIDWGKNCIRGMRKSNKIDSLGKGERGNGKGGH